MLSIAELRWRCDQRTANSASSCPQPRETLVKPILGLPTYA